MKIIDNFNYAVCNNKIFVLKWANRPGNIWDFCKKTEFILPYEDLEKINQDYEYTTVNEDPISLYQNNLLYTFISKSGLKYPK